MTPAVANLSLAGGTAYDVSLVVQDAAEQPVNLTGCALAASIKAASGSVVELAVTITDAAAGLATVHIPAQPLGMGGWELWMQAALETPRERVLRGLVTVSDRVAPRDEGNPSSHCLVVRLSDIVKVSLDSVDLAWWAYEQTRKLLGVDYATLCATSAQDAHTSSLNAATYSVEAMRHKDASNLSAAAAGMAERNAGQSATAADTARKQAQEALHLAREAMTAAQAALAAIPQVDQEGNMSLTGALTATNGTATLGNVIIDYLRSHNATITGPATFSAGVTMHQNLNVEGTAIIKSLLMSEPNIYFAKTDKGSRLEARTGIFSIGVGGRDVVNFEFLKEGMSIRTSITKTNAGALGLKDTSLLNRAEGDARWGKVRIDLTDAQYTDLAEKDATTFYILSDTGRVYLGNHALN